MRSTPQVPRLVAILFLGACAAPDAGRGTGDASGSGTPVSPTQAPAIATALREDASLKAAYVSSLEAKEALTARRTGDAARRASGAIQRLVNESMEGIHQDRVDMLEVLAEIADQAGSEESVNLARRRIAFYYVHGAGTYVDSMASALSTDRRKYNASLPHSAFRAALGAGLLGETPDPAAPRDADPAAPPVTPVALASQALEDGAVAEAGRRAAELVSAPGAIGWVNVRVIAVLPTSQSLSAAEDSLPVLKRDSSATFTGQSAKRSAKFW